MVEHRPLIRRAVLASISLALVAFVVVTAPSAAAAVTVNCGAGQSLQSKLNTVASGTTILIQGTCHGNFVITGKSLTLKGNPKATLDGMFSGSTIDVTTNDVLHLINLTVTGGGGVAAGGGVLSDGNVTLNHVKVSGNEASSATAAQGGGISTSGTVNVKSSSIVSNRATVAGAGTGAAVTAFGGGIFADGKITVTGSTVKGNVAAASNSSGRPTAQGGGLYSNAGVKISKSVVAGNHVGGSGDGPTAWGTAVYADAGLAVGSSVVSGNVASASSATASSATAGVPLFANTGNLALSASTLVNNIATADGGAGSGIAYTSAVSNLGSAKATKTLVQGNTGTSTGASATTAFAGVASFGTTTVTSSRIIENVEKATSTAGAAAAAYVVYGSAVTMSKTSVDRNSLSALADGGDAQAIGTVITNTADISASTISRNALTSRTMSANSATAAGGGIYAGVATIENSTIALNSVTGISPNPGGTTDAEGGGILLQDASPSTITGATIAGNRVSAAGATVTARAGGLDAGSNTTIQGSILGPNSAPSARDCYQGITSGGYNVVANANGCSFLNTTGDRLNKDPKLHKLANYGGPTQTMLIDGTSPARNNVPNAACSLPRDQRGVKRPQGPKCDSGAVELTAHEASRAFGSAMLRVARIEPRASAIAGTTARLRLPPRGGGAGILGHVSGS